MNTEIKFFTYNELKNPRAVELWFQHQEYSLFYLADHAAERVYLEAIEDVARRTEAPSLAMADCILRLEQRLDYIEKCLKIVADTFEE